MKLTPFSPKQLRVLTWWCRNSPDREKDALICDGSVRSGKSFCMSLSFVLWSFSAFQNASFALCGKTVTSLRRNMAGPLRTFLENMGFDCQERVSQNYMDVFYGKRRNRYYFFGGKDEASASLIQGMTLSGILFDEVALMPRSFVEQALARCSVEGSKFWFNCNPEHPMHWFHVNWISKAQEKNALHLHFTMEDNPSLSPQMIKRYENLYSGAFYSRFILGQWVCAQGLVYPMFDPQLHTFETPPAALERYVISCDYGTVNPSSFGLWGFDGRVWYRLREYYYDSRVRGIPRTDEEHYQGLEELAGDLPIQQVVADPSAASFLECIRRHGRFTVVKAQNQVMDGIRRVSEAIRQRKILISRQCIDTLREFTLYRYDPEALRDTPIKEHDHAMDDIRYFVSTVLAHDGEEEDFLALSISR